MRRMLRRQLTFLPRWPISQVSIPNKQGRHFSMDSQSFDFDPFDGIVIGSSSGSSVATADAEANDDGIPSELFDEVIEDAAAKAEKARLSAEKKAAKKAEREAAKAERAAKAANSKSEVEAGAEESDESSSPAGQPERTADHTDFFAIRAAEVLTTPTIGMRVNAREVTVFDIETGPVANIEELIGPLEECPPFDENSVKLGNLTDASKIRDKIEYARAKHAIDHAEKANAARNKKIDKAALSPMTGEIIAIGYGDATGRRVIHAASEREILREFWAIFRMATMPTNGGKLAGWYVFGFDLPFIVQRSWFHEIAIPAGVVQNNRYWNAAFIDLMDVFNLGRRDHSGLDDVARFFGVGEKNGDGGEFAKLWRSGEATERMKAVEYLTNDINLTLAVARRIGAV